MASPRKPQSHEPINLDEMFQVPPEWDDVPRPEPVVTGLSDEEDARRHLARRFNPDLKFCPNCEMIMDAKKTGFFCPHCRDTLAEIGTQPRRRKHT